MSTECCCSQAARIFSDWIIPEGFIQRRYLGDFYQKNPVMSRVIVTPLALLSGIVKVFLFPLICLVGIVVMPIMAIIRGKREGCEWLKAWCFSILGLAASFTFLTVTCYYLSLLASSALLVAILAISIILHVHALVKEPIAPSVKV